MSESNTPPPEPLPDLPGSNAITQSAKSNLALSFASLPEAERRAMSIFYAFCRVVDDVADSTELPIEEKQRQLGEWRKEIRRAYLDKPLTPLGQEMAQIIRTYLIAPTPLEESSTAWRWTCRLSAIRTLPCWSNTAIASPARSAWSASTSSVAAIPGRASTPSRSAWRSNSPIFLRDVKKDISFGRIYLPQDEMAAFGVTEAEIVEGRFSEKMRQLFRFQHHRARHYFAKAHRLMVPSGPPQAARGGDHARGLRRAAEQDRAPQF